jgi:hypothetical protein
MFISSPPVFRTHWTCRNYIIWTKWIDITHLVSFFFFYTFFIFSIKWDLPITPQMKMNCCCHVFIITLMSRATNDGSRICQHWQRSANCTGPTFLWQLIKLQILLRIKSTMVITRKVNTGNYSNQNNWSPVPTLNYEINDRVRWPVLTFHNYRSIHSCQKVVGLFLHLNLLFKTGKQQNYFNIQSSLSLSPPVLSPNSPIAKILVCPDFPHYKYPVILPNSATCLSSN